MSDYAVNEVLSAIVAASKTLSSRKEEINRLNVFPVPDGDTGTNMSLTMESVVNNLAQLTKDASCADVRRAITNGALMGARGNSGVITSQIMRGLCEGAADSGGLDTAVLDAAFARAQEVAFQAVRKPVEGTILTVLKDSAAAAKKARRKKMPIDDALSEVVKEAYASVDRTPELLEVLKENNVVDAGGYGLAILIDGFTEALTGQESAEDLLTLERPASTESAYSPKVAIEGIDDWEGSEYRYCTEFLVFSETVDVEEAKNFLPTMGDCDLMVGMHPNFKVHVHSNRPDQVLGWFLTHDAQISEVHVHNMDLQSKDRNEKLIQESAASEAPAPAPEHKDLGFVAVAVGDGNAAILKSLGVDVVVSGGQTMNPPVEQLVEAINQVNADKVIILPNNSNIIMTAESAAAVVDVPCGVVRTKSIPQAFSALFGVLAEGTLEENVESMTESFADVKVGEVTEAVRDSRDAYGNPINPGDTIGISDGAIEAVGETVESVVLDLLENMEAEDADNCTLLAGADYTDEQLDALVESIEEKYEDLEVDAQRGGQPLYPIILSVE